MQPIAEFTPRFATFPLDAAARRLKPVSRAVLGYLAEQRRAKAAEEAYSQLSRLSDAELARRGLERARLAAVVRERLY